MEQADIPSRRLRWSAIATGIVSAIALFPIMFFQYPALLIAGGILLPRTPIAGRWLTWAGALELWSILIIYDAMFLQPGSLPLYFALAFPASTILLTWCSIELVFDAVKHLRARRWAQGAPKPVGWGVWSAAVVLNLMMAWFGYGLVEGYRLQGALHLQTPVYPYVTPLVVVVVTIAFDVFLARRVIKMKAAVGADR